MNELICRSCKFFHQHYGLSQGKLHWIYCGHCVYARIAKHKRPDNKACEHYALGETLESTFVTKEYLTKALLGKVLKMELLPECLETPE